MGTIGRSAVVPKDIPTAISTKHLAVVTLNKEKANPYFISFCVHCHPFVLQQISFKNSGAIMDGLNLGKIKSLRIPLPPLDSQNKFAQIWESTEQQRELMQRSLAEMETTFNSLMQRAFQGELF
jgi:type I restriction enzyme, S subunit